MKAKASKKEKIEDYSHIQKILKEISDYLERNRASTFPVSHWPEFKGKRETGVHYLSFILIAKTISVKVNNIINNSVFQPYETTDDKKYCVLSILQIGDCDKYPEYISNLIKVGCPLYKFIRPEDVGYVLDGIK